MVASNRPNILTVAEVAGDLRVSEKTVLREIRDGNLEATPVRRKWRISPDDLETYKARRHRVVPDAKPHKNSQRSAALVAAEAEMDDAMKPSRKQRTRS